MKSTDFTISGVKSEKILKKSTKWQGFQRKYCEYCKFRTDLNWQIWDELTFSPESDNDAGGEELETIENKPKNDKFNGFKLRILKI